MVCTTPRPMAVGKGVTAVSWRTLPSILRGFRSQKAARSNPRIE
jgi:hypothetical protein